MTSSLLWRITVAIFLTTILNAGEAPSRFAKLDGARVHYKSYGTGPEALVFIHGWTCDLTFWRFQAPVYEKRRSLLIDLPGHGGSDRPELSYSRELFARGVEAVMRDAGVEKAVLVGHSMGVPVAMTFLRLFPKKGSGIVLVDGAIPRPPKDEAGRQKAVAQAEAFAKTFHSPECKAAVTKMIEGMFTSQTPDALRQDIRTKMLATPHHVRTSAMDGMMALMGSSPEGMKFEVPALAIMARRGAGRPGYEEYLRTQFPRLAAYQEWEGAGHFLMMEQPERFNAALVEFLRKP